MKKIRIQLLTLFCLSSILYKVNAQNSSNDQSYILKEQSFEERTELLVQQMTLDEKISQLMNDAKAIPRLDIKPYNWWNESLHGVARAGYATVFPQSITVASSFNRQLIYDIGEAISDEARAKHHEFQRHNNFQIYTGLTFWSPNINIFRDPRWGRGHETYGEDPYLTGELATQYILAMQGNHPKYFKTIATAKHFAVHSGPEALRHSFDVDVNDRDLYETYLPAFKKTVEQAKVYSVMGAYNRFRGQSASGSDFLLNQILRKDWKFDGYVVSDCGAIRDIHTNHKIASTKQEAAAIGLNNGCDLECGDYYSNLKLAVQENLVSEATINQAVKRLLLAQFKLGFYDDEKDNPYAKIPISIVNNPSHIDLARKAAQESIILLKNEHQILPLNQDKYQKIAVIGPNADNWESLLGNYHGTVKNPITFLKGIQKKVEPKIKITYAEGAELDADKTNLKPIPSVFFRTKDGKQGLNASYYSNTTFEGDPLIQKIDDQINFVWEHQPLSKELMNNYSVRWEGFLQPTSNGIYDIGVLSKKGMKVILNGTEISNGKGSAHHEKYASKKIELKANQSYPITAEFYNDTTDATAHLLWNNTSENKIQQAVELAKASDLTVLVLGLSQRLEAEGGDKKEINLPETQIELLQALKQTNKPLVLVLNAGSALAINWAKENVDAILNVGYPGEQGGNALADVLFGDYNPAGRLPITYYQSMEDLPAFENYDMKGRTYRYFEGEPLYQFGYGLSYTTFEYSNLIIPSTIDLNKDIIIKATVKNTGQMDGDEVVQLYLKDVKASTPRPRIQLEGFERIYLKKGEKREVEIRLNPDQFSVIDKNGNRIIEPGEFEIYIGGKQPNLKTKDSTILKGNLKIKQFKTFSK